MSIKILSKDVASKIAAGEVIENPFNVIKELVENSIDANSTLIEISLEDNGKKEILIKDNGIGMNKEDLILSIKKHATSKIDSLQDLFNIKSLGFRGEALHSIQEVSKIKITSSKDGIDANSIDNLEDKITITPCGRNKGTTIIVKDLFYNLPARKKFILKDKLTQRKIIDLITNYSLLYPKIHFILKNNNQELLNFPSTDEINRIIQIYSSEIKKSLIKIEGKDDEYQLKGYISLPDYSRTSNIIHIFVNNRPIESKEIEAEIKNAYSRLLDKKNPFATIYLTCPNEEIDVNVHPKKTTINFLNEKIVKDLVFNTIKKFLFEKEYIPNQVIKNDEKEVTTTINEYDLEKSTDDKTSSNTIENDDFKAKEEKLSPLFKIKEQSSLIYDEKPINFQEEEIKENKNKFEEKKEDIDWRYIGQFNKTYLLFEDNLDKKLMIVDQHAAAERINYEELDSNYKDKKIEVQYLIDSKYLNLKKSEIITIEENQVFLKNIGFDIEVFGANSIKINSIPILFNKEINENTIFELINQLDSNANLIEDKKKHVIETIACKSSIKAGKELNNNYAINLINRLFKCKYPYTCPHGRPIIITLTNKEFEKMFFRTEKS